MQRHLPGEEISRIANQMKYLVYKSGEEIIRHGDEGDSMFILVEGIADVLVPDDHKTVRVGQISPGQFFGEMSMLTGERRSADVVALTDLIVYKLQRQDLVQTFHKHPQFIEKISEILVERKYQNAKLLEKSTEHAPVKSPESSTLLVDKIRSFFKISKSSQK